MTELAEYIQIQTALEIWRLQFKNTIVILDKLGISPEIAAKSFTELLKEKLEEKD